MKNFFFLALIIFTIAFLKSCNSYPMNTAHKSDMDRNAEELQKRQQAEKNKIEANEFNNFGKPDNK